MIVIPRLRKKLVPSRNGKPGNIQGPGMGMYGGPSYISAALEMILPPLCWIATWVGVVVKKKNDRPLPYTREQIARFTLKI